MRRLKSFLFYTFVAVYDIYSRMLFDVASLVTVTVHREKINGKEGKPSSKRKTESIFIININQFKSLYSTLVTTYANGNLCKAFDSFHINSKE